jgi:hypothetical protein
VKYEQVQYEISVLELAHGSLSRRLWYQGRKEGRKEGGIKKGRDVKLRKDGRKEGRKVESRKEGRKAGRNQGRKAGRKEHLGVDEDEQFALTIFKGVGGGGEKLKVPCHARYRETGHFVLSPGIFADLLDKISVGLFQIVRNGSVPVRFVGTVPVPSLDSALGHQQLHRFRAGVEPVHKKR